MFAGFDTSASAIHWILFFVGHHPEMVKRIGQGGHLSTLELSTEGDFLVHRLYES